MSSAELQTLLEEIAEQPSVVERTLHRQAKAVAEVARTLHEREPSAIGVSQSGQDEDVVEYVREARKQGAPTVAIVNDSGSPSAQAADHVLLCEAGPERSVPATKTVTAQMTLLAVLSCELEDPANGPGPLRASPAAMQAAVDQRAKAAALAQTLASAALAAIIGRGFAFPVALGAAPIVALVLAQLFAVELALALGLDPARPRGLHKVTSTR